jgi:rod shape determining protein RodA
VNIILGHYQVGRIETFLKPDVKADDFFQVNNSLLAICGGQLTGKGLYNGSYVPYGINDFIFSLIGEELGFIGCTATIGAIFIIISKCLIIAHKAPDLLGKLIASGVAGLFAFEVFVNVGVVTSIIPNTGMPFPFLSSGGSALWVNMACVGLVLNVGLYKTKSIFEG